MSKLFKILIISLLVNLTAYSYFDTLFLKIAYWQLKGLISFSLIDFIKDISSVKKMDLYSQKRARIRNSESLCRRECAFLEKRKLFIKAGAEKFLECDLSETELPNVALCFSGGGYRSMIGTLAILKVSEEMGLLDTINYISSLSGSTWALSTWLGHDLDFNDLITLTRSQISGSIIGGIDRRLLLENGIWKLFYGQKMSLVGIWGSIIANVLFSDFEKNYIGSAQMRILRGKMPKLSQFRFKIAKGNLPMPIFTAVSVSDRYQWVEFNPYEVGLIGHNKYIPSWSFGRRFDKGLSTDYAPEHGIDYLMGIWGSAFTASLGEILNHCSNKKLLEEVAGVPKKKPGILTGDITAKLRSDFLKLRLSPARIKNMEIEDEGSFLTLVDAGVDFNLPVPPLLKKERKIDLIIICDLSSNAETASELRYAEKYAEKNELRFPKISYEGIEQSIISIFKDPDPEVPVVIYIPMLKNDNYSKTFDPKNLVKMGGYCSTFNLQYTPQQFDELFGLMSYNLSCSMPQIKEALKFVVDKKKIMRA